MRQQIRSRWPIRAPTGAFPPNKSAGLSARSCVTSQVQSQHRLSSFLLTKDGSRGCNAVGCANTNDHRPTNTRNSFSAPEAVLSEVATIKFSKYLWPWHGFTRVQAFLCLVAAALVTIWPAVTLATSFASHFDTGPKGLKDWNKMINKSLQSS